MISIKEGCHPELVEGSRAETLPAMLRQAQHDSFLIMSWLGNKDDKWGDNNVFSDWRMESREWFPVDMQEQKGYQRKKP
ncbi:hypothetical protein SAMN05192574_1132 [Mucilaginibacter gossypiicola]|uniref:Uncharacterized protein n=1 Tax=Mucilaginibacter gossypiicola TaxID=551995 RepID=A0A1H8SJ80_9SPHI|nr:hypothetical protein SAMN05192574_1132 [Mucilaginibacter gossypiicola]